MHGRVDSPNADHEGIHFVVSFCVSHRVPIKCGDLDHGYFQGLKLTHKIMLEQPPSGLPDVNVKPDDGLLALVPIYGTKEAGRGLWLRVRAIFLKLGLRENIILQAVYSYSSGGRCLLIIATHVDDFLWGSLSEAEHIIDAIKRELKLGKEAVWKFTF